MIDSIMSRQSMDPSVPQTSHYSITYCSDYMIQIYIRIYEYNVKIHHRRVYVTGGSSASTARPKKT